MTEPQLHDIFAANTHGMQRMTDLLNAPSVSQITCDAFDRIVYVDEDGPKRAEGTFANAGEYVDWLNHLMTLTDVGYTDVEAANVSVIEGSFRSDRVTVHGSIHICTRELTRGEPTLTIRKQPISLITLDAMLNQNMMSSEMREFLELAVRGRSNILISGGSGAGKTTLARALSYFIDPWNRVVTCEEIDELHLKDRLSNVVPLTTFRRRGPDGELVRETTLQDLVRESLRMRADRVWVGETRGQEAYALVKAANSGHDGSVTTLHADTGKQATKQLTTYVMESGLTEHVAQQQVSEAFDLVVQINKVRMDRRVITEISELESVIEGNGNQRLNPIFKYDYETDSFGRAQKPSSRFLAKWARYGVQTGGRVSR